MVMVTAVAPAPAAMLVGEKVTVAPLGNAGELLYDNVTGALKVTPLVSSGVADLKVGDSLPDGVSVRL
jgi:hypothetical protein